MKTRFISFFLFMLAMSCFVACSDDDPATDPEPEPELEPVETVNTYTYKDKTIQAKSVSCFEQDGIVYVCMSPLQSLETLEDFMNSGKEYVMLGVDKGLVGSPVTVGSSEDDDYVLYYMDADGEAIVAVDPYEWEDVLTQGKITLTMTPGENETSAVKATFDCTLKSGGKFTGEAGCNYKAPAKLSSEFSFGSEVRPLKSAVATVIGGIQYLYLSPDAGVTTVEDMSDTEFLMIGINPDMLGQVLDITSYDGTDYAFYNMTELGADDLTAVDPYGWSEICSAGKFKVEKTDNRVKITFSFTLLSGGKFEGSYEGAYSEIKQSTTNILTLNGENTRDIKATFYEKTDEGVALYLTPSRISSAADLENVNTYYVRLFVPNAGLNGQEVDITNTNLAFEFTYYSPYDEERIQISKGHLEDAAGTFSVSKSADNEYSLTLNLKYLGDNSLKISGNYNGAFAVYDTTIPNEYRLGADGTPVTIQSVVIDKTDADICVIYLSRQPGITTVAGMSAADAVVRLSKTMLDGVLRGFSGDDENVKISITYEGVTYSRANTTLGNLALGGRTSVSLQGNEVEMTFEVVGIKKYGDASLSGYYKGAVTVIE
ncbi:hypothetical protein [Bacteroides ovatus]|uniref:hypothetical protein n=1 Tax=Bacteroides ovatus TaxID=28116 RepID=UPI003983F583